MAVTVDADWVNATLAALQRKGLRNGGARRAVIELLGGQDCCLTAQEIFDRLRVSDRRVGIASVYRVLDLLTSEGFVQRIDLGSGIARYEPVHAGGAHHHQGFARLGAGLRPAAHDDDGNVEALELDDARFTVGVLWHPEAGEDKRLFESLVAEAAAYRLERER